jgi:GNAT superfamily N-acetyltransferase
VTDTATERVGALSPQEQMVLAEGAEADFMFDFERGAPDGAQRELGMHQERLGPVAVLAMREDPTGGYWSKTLGFRADTPASDELVGRVLDVYRANGSPVAVIQVPAGARPEDWDDVCARHGLVAGQTWVKLLRPADLDAEPASTDLRVGPAGPADAHDWSVAYCRGFGMPEHPALIDFFGAATGGAGGFHPWAAWDGDRLVAAANLHVAGPAAAFCGAATLPEARGRGAQSAFMQRRVEQARELGAGWLSAETWKEGAGQHNPSLHNMHRAGFVDVYDRTNFIWRAPG